jgi:hypothetical protein
MQEDEQAKPTISLSTGETGHCVRDAATNHFLCSVDHPAQTSLAASSGGFKMSSSSKLSTAQVGIIIGSVAALCIIAILAVKAVKENKKRAAKAAAAIGDGSGSVLLVNEESYATA